MLIDIDLKRFWEIKGNIREARERKKVMELYGAAYTAEGIITLAGRPALYERPGYGRCGGRCA